MVPLAMSSSYIFQVFGKCILSIMLFSAWHGLAVLPVLLSFVQPASYVDLRAKLGEAGGDTALGDLSTVFPESPGPAGTDCKITAL